MVIVPQILHGLKLSLFAWFNTLWALLMALAILLLRARYV